MTEKSYRTMLVQHARRDEYRFKEAARDALRALIADADHKLAELESGRLSTTVGGAALNHQTFMDAERNLVRWWDARCVCAVVEDATEEA